MLLSMNANLRPVWFEDNSALAVNEIFDSIEGEGKRVGELATFIRLAGCNLRCSYCDTTYAFAEKHMMGLQDILAKVHYPAVTLTGGEPLMQEVRPLLEALKSHTVNVETNGSIDISRYFDLDNVFFTVDFKCGTSGETSKMLPYNFKHLRKRDVLKFVVGSHEDLVQAKNLYLFHYDNLRNRQIFVSPVFGQIEPAEIVDFLKAEGLRKWRVQLQLHKFIWDPEKRGV